MSKEFEFRVRGDKQSFIRMLKRNKIQYSFLPTSGKHARTVDRESTSGGIVNILAQAMTIDDMVLKVAVGLTPFILQVVWKWYQRKRKDSHLCVKVEGNVLDLNEKNVEILMSVLKSTSKRKRRNRGELK